MKNSFSILIICFLSLTSYSSNPITANKDSISADTASNYSVVTSGKSNSIRITRNGRILRSGEVKQARNKIEVNGERNSVNITENGSGGTVRIQQNGNQNKINITQTNEKMDK